MFTALNNTGCSYLNGGCEHICNTVNGQAQCSCRTGYDINADLHSCDGR